MPYGQVERMTHMGDSLAFERQDGAAPTFVWLSGFRSDMSGTKAQALADWAKARGQGFVRFDYSGHGQSSGRYEEHGIGRWLSEALAVIDAQTKGPVALVGSSMGGWIALLAAQARPERVKALLLIAPAADFVEKLMWPSFSDEQKAEIAVIGRVELPSEYDPVPTVITRHLIEDGLQHNVMGAPIRFDGRVHILQGGQDPDVPAEHARALADLIEATELRFERIEDGDHRLSRPQDIARLIAAADALAR
jgi:pimeloyl-ACP methyl ester carboxylesterase